MATSVGIIHHEDNKNNPIIINNNDPASTDDVVDYKKSVETVDTSIHFENSVQDSLAAETVSTIPGLNETSYMENTLNHSSTLSSPDNNKKMKETTTSFPSLYSTGGKSMNSSTKSSHSGLRVTFDRQVFIENSPYTIPIESKRLGPSLKEYSRKRKKQKQKAAQEKALAAAKRKNNKKNKNNHHHHHNNQDDSPKKSNNNKNIELVNVDDNAANNFNASQGYESDEISTSGITMSQVNLPASYTIEANAKRDVGIMLELKIEDTLELIGKMRVYGHTTLSSIRSLASRFYNLNDSFIFIASRTGREIVKANEKFILISSLAEPIEAYNTETRRASIKIRTLNQTSSGMVLEPLSKPKTQQQQQQQKLMLKSEREEADILAENNNNNNGEEKSERQMMREYAYEVNRGVKNCTFSLVLDQYLSNAKDISETDNNNNTLEDSSSVALSKTTKEGKTKRRTMSSTDTTHLSSEVEIPHLKITDAEIRSVLEYFKLIHKSNAIGPPKRIRLDFFLNKLIQINTNFVYIPSKTGKKSIENTLIEIHRTIQGLIKFWRAQRQSKVAVEQRSRQSLGRDLDKLIEFIFRNSTSDCILIDDIDYLFKMTSLVVASRRIMKLVLSSAKRISNVLDANDPFKYCKDETDETMINTDGFRTIAQQAGLEEFESESIIQYLNPNYPSGQVKIVDLQDLLQRADEEYTNRLNRRIDELLCSNKIRRDTSKIKSDEDKPFTINFGPEDVKRFIEHFRARGYDSIELQDLRYIMRKAMRVRSLLDQNVINEMKEIYKKVKAGIENSPEPSIEAWFTDLQAERKLIITDKLTIDEIREKYHNLTKEIIPISTRQLHVGFRKLPAEPGKKKPILTEVEINKLIGFLYPKKDTNVVIDELQKKFKRLERTEQDEHDGAELGYLCQHLDAYLVGKALKLSDFFYNVAGPTELQSDRLGFRPLSLDSLEAKILNTMNPDFSYTAYLQTFKEEMLNHIVLEDAEKTRSESKVTELVLEAERNGAADIMRLLKTKMDEKGLKLRNLFGGQTRGLSITRDDVRIAFEKVIYPAKKSADAAKKFESKLLQRWKKDAAFYKQIQEVYDIMDAARAKGTFQTIVDIENMMKQKQMKTRDIFKRVKLEKPDYFNAQELYWALKICGFDAKTFLIDRFTQFLDSKSVGYISFEVMDNMIKIYRTYMWKKAFNGEINLPLHLRFENMLDIFKGCDVITFTITQTDLTNALRRLRCDAEILGESKFKDIHPEELNRRSLVASGLNMLRNVLEAKGANILDTDFGLGKDKKSITKEQFTKYMLNQKKDNAADGKVIKQKTTVEIAQISPFEIENVCDYIILNVKPLKIDKIELMFKLLEDRNSNRKIQFASYFAILNLLEKVRSDGFGPQDIISNLKDVKLQKIYIKTGDFSKILRRRGCSRSDSELLEIFMDPKNTGKVVIDEFGKLFQVAENWYNGLIQRSLANSTVKAESHSASKEIGVKGGTTILTDEEVNNMTDYLLGYNLPSEFIFPDVVAIIRKVHKDAKNQEIWKEEGKKLLTTFEIGIELSGMSVNEWFEHSQSRNGSKLNPGKLKARDMRASLKKLKNSRNEDLFSEFDIVKLINYIQPDTKDFITIELLEDGLKRLQETTEEEIKLQDCFRLTSTFMTFLKEKSLKVSDLFRIRYGSDETQPLTADGFKKKVLETLHPVNWYAEHQAKRKNEMIANVKIEIDSYIKEQVKFVDVILNAHKSGVLEVLKRFNQRSLEKGIKIADCLDDDHRSPEATLSKKVLHNAIKKLISPNPASQLAAQMASQRVIRKQEEVQERIEKIADLWNLIDDCDKRGALVGIIVFEDFIRQQKCSVTDLFNLIDVDGSKDCDLEEMHEMVRKFGIDLSEEDTEKMFHYVDADKGGTVDFEELEYVVRQYRRYAVLKLKAEAPVQTINTHQVKAVVDYLDYGRTGKILVNDLRTALLHGELANAFRRSDVNAQKLPGWEEELEEKISNPAFGSRYSGMMTPNKSYGENRLSLKRVSDASANDKVVATNLGSVWRQGKKIGSNFFLVQFRDLDAEGLAIEGYNPLNSEKWILLPKQLDRKVVQKRFIKLKLPDKVQFCQKILEHMDYNKSVGLHVRTDELKGEIEKVEEMRLIYQSSSRNNY